MVSEMKILSSKSKAFYMEKYPRYNVQLPMRINPIPARSDIYLWLTYSQMTLPKNTPRAEVTISANDEPIKTAILFVPYSAEKTIVAS
jgi:hypothetical protein